MRFYEFRLSEKDYIPTSIRGLRRQVFPDPRQAQLVVQSGPPYPEADKDTVKLIQTKLQALGYSVGSTGVDGKYGPRTTKAVGAWKRDNGVFGTDDAMTKKEIEQLLSTEKMNPNKEKEVDISTGGLEGIANLSTAKETVEDFLGSSVTDKELDFLIRAVAAEASPNSKERAAVAAVILNRVRSSGYPSSIIRVLKQKNQFQAVTGTRYDRGPSSNFTNMSDLTASQVIGALVKYLPKMDKSWLNFTSNNPKAYGKGTNIDFMYAMRNASDAQVIGQTVFGTV